MLIQAIFLLKSLFFKTVSVPVTGVAGLLYLEVFLCNVWTNQNILYLVKEISVPCSL